MKSKILSMLMIGGLTFSTVLSVTNFVIIDSKYKELKNNITMTDTKTDTKQVSNSKKEDKNSNKNNDSKQSEKQLEEQKSLINELNKKIDDQQNLINNLQNDINNLKNNNSSAQANNLNGRIEALEKDKDYLNKLYKATVSPASFGHFAICAINYYDNNEESARTNKCPSR